MSRWKEDVWNWAPPSAEEIADWADGIVYAETTDGTVVYFEPAIRKWLKARGTGPWREPTV